MSRFATIGWNIFWISIFLKFGLSEKHTKFEKIFLMVLTNQRIYLVNVKTMSKIFSNYVYFSKSPNVKNSTSNFEIFWPHCVSGVSWARNASHTWREISKPSYHTRLYSTNLVTFTCFLSLQIWLLCLYRIHKWDHCTV